MLCYYSWFSSYILIKYFIVLHDILFQLARVLSQWQKDDLRLRSRNAWLDLWFLAVCFLGLTLSISTSMANGLLFLFRIIQTTVIDYYFQNRNLYLGNQNLESFLNQEMNAFLLSNFSFGTKMKKKSLYHCKTKSTCRKKIQMKQKQKMKKWWRPPPHLPHISDRFLPEFLLFCKLRVLMNKLPDQNPRGPVSTL